MLVINCTAELKKINLRPEIHGDTPVRAMDLRFVAADVDGARLDAMIPDYQVKLYDEKGQPLLQEVYPLVVRHKIENTTVTIGIGKKTIKLTGADLKKKIKLTPRSAGKCDIDFTVQAADYPDNILDALSRNQGEIMTVEIVERQMTLGEMKQSEDKSA